MLRDFFVYLGMILSSFLVLVIVFTLFELLGDILRNQVPPTVVAEYLLNVTPYLLYNVAPLVMLLAVLVTFGLMQRSNEITAIKATGTSIYRIVTPVVVAAAVLAVALFFADQFYLPHTNKRQEALHNQIKGKPAQTYLRPDRKWIFGQHNDIYYYQFFDPDRDQFGNVTVFQLNRATFAITRRIHAERAHWADNLNRWVYEQGWDRTLNVSAIANYRQFDVATFPDLPETPAYFKKEVKQYTEMNYEELRRYIRDLQQSGFDVVRLRVQLAQEAVLPTDHADHGHTRHSLLAFDREKRSDHGSRGRRRHRCFLYGSIAPLRGHGRSQPAAASPRRMVAGPDLHSGGWISDSEGANVEEQASGVSPQPSAPRTAPRTFEGFSEFVIPQRGFIARGTCCFRPRE